MRSTRFVITIRDDKGPARYRATVKSEGRGGMHAAGRTLMGYSQSDTWEDGIGQRGYGCLDG